MKWSYGRQLHCLAPLLVKVCMKMIGEVLNLVIPQACPEQIVQI